MVLAFSSAFGYPYEIPKFLVFASTTFLLAFLFLLDRSPLYFFNRRLVYWGSASLVFLGISSALSSHGALFLSLTHICLWILFALLVAFESKKVGNDFFLEKLNLSFLPVVSFVVIVSLLFEIVLGSEVRKPFWGNVNIGGDFLAIGLLQIVFRLRLFSIAKHKKLMISILIMGLVVLLLYASRAAILGLSLATLFLYRENFKNKIKRGSSRGILIFSSIVLLGIFLYKGLSSLQSRLSHWVNTLSLIGESPFFGSGPASFPVLYEKFNGTMMSSGERVEHLLVTSPHNFFLETMVGVGVVGGLVFFGFLACILFNVVRLKDKKSISRNWVLANSLVYLPSLFFAFPQKLPFTLMFSSVILGLALSLQFESKKIKNAHSWALRVTLFLFASLCLWTLGNKAYAEFLTMNSSGSLKHEGLRKACALDPENWRSCAGLARSAIVAEDWQLADWAMSQLELRHSGYHPSLILKGEYYLKKAQPDLACLNLIQYQKLFLKPTSVDALIESNCQK